MPNAQMYEAGVTQFGVMMWFDRKLNNNMAAIRKISVEFGFMKIINELLKLGMQNLVWE
jgi:hypothetical protein